MDADIAACPEAYPHITTPDPNIDFRRVNTLDTFFRRHAQVLTCDLSDGHVGYTLASAGGHRGVR